MERFTISLDQRLADAFEALIAQRGYHSRSEAVRDLLRNELERSRAADGRQEQGECIASLSYVFDHHERELTKRLAALMHDHHRLCVSTMHVHLDHDDCLECTVLRGPAAEVRRFAEKTIAESGVRHGSLNLVSTDVEGGTGRRHAHRKRRA